MLKIHIEHPWWTWSHLTLRYVAVCRVAVCMLQHVAVCHEHDLTWRCGMLQCVCCSMLQCVVLQCACCSMLQCVMNMILPDVAVCCSVYVAVCCSVSCCSVYVAACSSVSCCSMYVAAYCSVSWTSSHLTFERSLDRLFRIFMVPSSGHVVFSTRTFWDFQDWDFWKSLHADQAVKIANKARGVHDQIMNILATIHNKPPWMSILNTDFWEFVRADQAVTLANRVRGVHDPMTHILSTIHNKHSQRWLSRICTCRSGSDISEWGTGSARSHAEHSLDQKERSHHWLLRICTCRSGSDIGESDAGSAKSHDQHSFDHSKWTSAPLTFENLQGDYLQSPKWHYRRESHAPNWLSRMFKNVLKMIGLFCKRDL